MRGLRPRRADTPGGAAGEAIRPASAVCAAEGGVAEGADALGLRLALRAVASPTLRNFTR